MRQSGKTTKLCQRVAAALEADPELQAVITGPYVMRNSNYYRVVLDKFGADQRRVRLWAPNSLDRLRGIKPVVLYVDDFEELSPHDQRVVEEAELMTKRVKWGPPRRWRQLRLWK